MIQESAIEFEHEVEDTEEVVDKFKKFLDEVTPEDFASGGQLGVTLAVSSGRGCRAAGRSTRASASSTSRSDQLVER